MLHVLVIVSLLSAALCAAENPIKEISARAIIDHRMPKFRNGYLYVVDPSHIVTIFDPDGKQLTPIVITGRKHGHVSIQAVGTDTDGTLAIAWSDSPDAGIDFRDQFGQQVRTMDTGRFVVTDLGFGEDHVLWTIGWQRDTLKPNAEEVGDYSIVRKYSADGLMLGAYLPKSLFAPGLPPGSDKLERGITVTHDRVGIEVISGHISDQQEWIELGFEGNLKGRWKLDPLSGGVGVALTSDGQAYLERYDAPTKTHLIFRLNHETGTWSQVSPLNGVMYGADDTALVLAQWQRDIMHLMWYAQPPVAPTTTSR